MRKAPVRLLAAATVIAAGLFASACSGGSTPGVASLGTTSTTAAATAQGTSSSTKPQSALKFAECMRSHGVKNYPDPNKTGATQISSSSGIDPNSPTFQAANKDCQSLLPKPSAAQKQQLEQNALKFSKCMRSHGVTNFPDPTFKTGISIKVGGGPGTNKLNPDSPTFQRAQQACGKYMHLPGGGPPKTPGGGGGSTFSQAPAG